ncbi:TetR/AcrR family transcriptional regulator [Aidingimonas halophila]|uniref:Transcriptional regulator, TetR family n=1 Tax=Aidingimonas halophila TaxID=574349 RepID=A0A1H3D397_9GAMM|nr:TetR/AcrR family transcriptional regulator [Aidingimonas halophila]SDX60867.1 transcriptional regulator, TetR family [Aidingimonas halophila]
MKRNATRDELIRVGSDIIARQGYNTTGLNEVLSAAGVPKGSFYYYFTSKEDFGLAVIDDFASAYESRLDATLGDTSKTPLERLRAYFAEGVSEMASCECTRGCLIGNLGQELAARNDAFRDRLECVFRSWERRFADCLEAARKAGELRPDCDPQSLAGFLLTGWEGAILRAKVTQSVAPMTTFIDILLSHLLVEDPAA